MELQTLARPYAKAVFEVAREGGALAPWSDFLAVLAAIVRNPVLVPLLGSPALTREQLAGVLTDTLATTGLQHAPQWPHMRTLIKLLVENHRLALAPAIATAYDTLRAQAESRVDVQITTADKVAVQQAEKLSAAISKRLARSVDIQWNTDADLLGGAVIRAGDLVIDGSLKGELKRLSQALSH